MASASAPGDGDSETDSDEDVPLWARHSPEDCADELERLDAADPAQCDGDATRGARRRARLEARLDALEALAEAEAPRAEALELLRFTLVHAAHPDKEVAEPCEMVTWAELQESLGTAVHVTSDCLLVVHTTAGEASGEGVPLLPALLGKVVIPGLAEASGGVCADGLLPVVRAGCCGPRGARAVPNPFLTCRAALALSAERHAHAPAAGAARSHRPGARRRRDVCRAAAPLSQPCEWRCFTRLCVLRLLRPQVAQRI